MRSLLIAAGLLLLPAAQAQEIYKWVDKDGVVHYSDQPGSPDAKPVHVSVPRSDDAGTVTPPDSGVPSQEPLGAGYRGLVIASPATGENFYGGTDVVVPVSVRLDGELRPGHRVAVYVDGSPRADIAGLSGRVSGLPRGAHTIRAAVLNDAGRELIASATNTFYIQQQSVAKPPVGPALRPPPKVPRPVPHTK